MPDTFFFIQARSSSTRLPGKTLLPVWKDKTIVQLLIERIQFHFPDNPVALLTTNNPADDELEASVQRYPIRIFRGNEQNVLDRFIQAGIQFGAEDIVRVCADNPFLLWESLKELLNQDFTHTDYSSFSFRGNPVMKCHFGLYAERIKLSALKKVSASTEEPLYLEHVTNYIYEHPDRFSVLLTDKTTELAALEFFRLTVDTPSDMENAKLLLQHTPDPVSPRLNDIIEIKRLFPALEISMRNEIKNNSK